MIPSDAPMVGDVPAGGFSNVRRKGISFQLEEAGDWLERSAFGVVVVVFALLYVITTPLSPSLAAEQYIEDRYDAVAEDVVSFALQERSLKTEFGRRGRRVHYRAGCALFLLAGPGLGDSRGHLLPVLPC